MPLVLYAAIVLTAAVLVAGLTLGVLLDLTKEARS